MPTVHEKQALEDFGLRYSRGAGSGSAAVERAVIGAVWGANGYTTRPQADMLADRLGLRRSDLLLDFGTGRGWPGVYLAKKAGCRVVLTDLPIEGLRIAEQRARSEGVELLGSVVASGKHLPFGRERFEAIVHTDVLC